VTWLLVPAVMWLAALWLARREDRAALHSAGEGVAGCPVPVTPGSAREWL
jgi:hypothetical protein